MNRAEHKKVFRSELERKVEAQLRDMSVRDRKVYVSMCALTVLVSERIEDERKKRIQA